MLLIVEGMKTALKIHFVCMYRLVPTLLFSSDSWLFPSNVRCLCFSILWNLLFFDTYYFFLYSNKYIEYGNIKPVHHDTHTLSKVLSSKHDTWGEEKSLGFALYVNICAVISGSKIVGRPHRDILT